VRIAIRMLLLAALPVAILGPTVTWVATSHLEGHLLDRIEHSGRNVLKLQAANLESSFAYRLGELGLLAGTPDLQSADVDRILPVLREAERRSWGEFEGLYWNTLSGTVTATDGESVSVADRGYFPALQAGETVITPVLESRITGRRIVLLLVPVIHPERGHVGTIGGSMLVETLLAEAERLSVGGSGRILVLDENGDLVVGHGPSDDLPPGEVVAARVRAGVARDEAGFVVLDDVAPPVLVQSIPLVRPPWQLLVVHPRSALFGQVERARQTGWKLIGACLLLAGGIAVLVTRTLTAPLERVVEAIRRFELRDPHTGPLPEDRRDEIGELARSFHAMTDRVAREETQRKAAEVALRQSQKMEGLGLLAGGIAHDFNNLLTVIVGNAELARTGIDDPDRRAELSAIADAAERGAALTRRILTFARRQPANPQKVLLGDAVKELEPVLGRLLPAPISLAVHASPEPVWVRIDPGQLEQVVMNLTVNARDALSGGGTITIAVDPVDVDGTYASLSPGATPGQHARLTVTDDGAGIDAASLQRVFEPFFTTKPTGEGTGLGLSICHGIVTQNDGQISIQSEPGRGTRVMIHLPRVDAPTPREREVPAAAGRREGREVLVVEDDPAVREILTGTLRSFGHRVTALDSAEDARAWFATHPRRKIDLLVVDVVLPGRSGPELVSRLEEERRDLAVLYVSGYPQRMETLKGSCVLQKPFRRVDLAEAIDRALGRTEAERTG